MISKYRKKPCIIEAIQFDGTNQQEIKDWCKEHVIILTDGTLDIPTLEGTMHASVGDYIICGVKNDYYPCKPELFDLTYDKVEG